MMLTLCGIVLFGVLCTAMVACVMVAFV